ncbi:MAG: TonB family protein [Betaproteobacteria bacterium]|nr:TonB family protein [Betaproteobacteria bacterium]
MQPYAPALPDLRLLWRTVVASLLLHALILVPARGLPPDEAGRPAEANPLRARLTSQPPITPPRIETAPVEPLPASESRPTETRRAEPAPRQQEAAPPAARAETEAPSATDQAPPVATPETWRPRIDTTGLRQYHMALAQSAGRFRVYPQALREAGIGGRVMLRLAVGSEGRPLGIAVLGSSGSGELDAAAVEMIRLAASHTPVPELLQGQDFTIDLVLNYDPAEAP